MFQFIVELLVANGIIGQAVKAVPSKGEHGLTFEQQMEAWRKNNPDKV